MNSKYIFVLFLFGFILSTAPVFADTSISLMPNTVDVVEGERVKLAIGINPKETRAYTAKIEIYFPSDVLEVESFSLNDPWLPLDQSGYSFLNNEAGVLIKTGGYPGGVSSPAIFGEVTFLAKKMGNALVRVGPNSVVLDKNNEDVFNFVDPVQSLVCVKQTEKFIVPDEIPPGYVFEKELKLGDKNISVAHLQLCLKSQEFYNREVTGHLDLDTKDAISKFQEEYFGESLISEDLNLNASLTNEDTNRKLTEVCFLEFSRSPERLFDINLGIENKRVSNVKDLSSNVSLFNFSEIPIPVELNFSIYDDLGNSVYEAKDHTVVETRKSLNRKFANLNLPPGEYTLRLTALYNIDVANTFTQDFEIVKKSSSFWLDGYVLGSLIVLLLGILLTIFFWIKIKKKYKREKVIDLSK